MWYLGIIGVVLLVLALLNWYYDRRGKNEILWLLLAIFVCPIGAVLFFVDKTYKHI